MPSGVYDRKERLLRYAGLKEMAIGEARCFVVQDKMAQKILKCRIERNVKGYVLFRMVAHKHSNGTRVAWILRVE
jgi:hypothetical protein